MDGQTGQTAKAGCATLGAALLLLAGCAATATRSSDLARLDLFGGNAPRFSVYVSCAGQVSAETAMCWVPAKYFSQWARERKVQLRELPDGETFDAATGVPIAERFRADAGLDYRIVVRFAPFATASYSGEDGGFGGYVAPKAGYLADLYVYSSASGKLVAHENFHKRTEAAYKSDAIPYVKAGVQTIIAALDPDAAERAVVE